MMRGWEWPAGKYWRVKNYESPPNHLLKERYISLAKMHCWKKNCPGVRLSKSDDTEKKYALKRESERERERV